MCHRCLVSPHMTSRSDCSVSNYGSCCSFPLVLEEGDAPKPKQARRAQQEQQVQLREPPLASGGEQPPSAPNSSAAAAPLLSPSAATFNTSGAAHVVRRAFFLDPGASLPPGWVVITISHMT